MAPEKPSKSAKSSKEEFDIISNRVAIALSKHDNLIKSWISASSRPQPPPKSQEELDAEDASLFRNEPPFLGVGAPIPSHFLVSEAERNNKSLRAKFFPTRGLRASKSRDAEEKAASAKRGLTEVSSDEEEGRSGVGTAKKQRAVSQTPAHIEEIGKGFKPEFKENKVKPDSSPNPSPPKLSRISGTTHASNHQLGTSSRAADDKANNASEATAKGPLLTDSKDPGISEIQNQVSPVLNQNVLTPSSSVEASKRDKLKEKKKRQKREKKKRQQMIAESNLINES